MRNGQVDLSGLGDFTANTRVVTIGAMAVGIGRAAYEFGEMVL